eukprot:scaffold3010_cov76-Isochrysis_galbana.AAC.4
MHAEKLDPFRRWPALPGVTGGWDAKLPTLPALHREPGRSEDGLAGEPGGPAPSSLPIEAEPQEPRLPADRLAPIDPPMPTERLPLPVPGSSCRPATSMLSTRGGAAGHAPRPATAAPPLPDGASPDTSLDASRDAPPSPLPEASVDASPAAGLFVDTSPDASPDASVAGRRPAREGVSAAGAANPGRRGYGEAGGAMGEGLTRRLGRDPACLPLPVGVDGRDVRPAVRSTVRKE